ncbi:hypothetical protein [Ascidiimonas aurantiaca]|uniref:hypothetical protein n=1 Tax=Ascidiimonas aurantiaca TaxID=1685432 RepID=UPI0030EC0038
MKLIFSLVLLLSLILRPTILLVNLIDYHYNIVYIIENFCVNKEKPELNCDGKCYLAQKLTSTEQPADSNNGDFTINFELFVPLFFNGCLKLESLLKLSSVLKSNFLYLDISGMELSEVIDPPPKFLFVYKHLS